MATELKNCSAVIGQHLGAPMELPSNCVMTLMIDVSVTKEADREVWGTGLLTYTITLVNDSGEAITGTSLEDILDPALIKLVDKSVTVTVNDVPVANPVYTYDDVSGLLKVTLDNVPADAIVVVTFQVEKKTQP